MNKLFTKFKSKTIAIGFVCVAGTWFFGKKLIDTLTDYNNDEDYEPLTDEEIKDTLGI